VGGVAASYADSQSAIGSRGLWALGWVALATLIVLFLYTGSIVLPLKAVALNVLSLGATLGVLVWVFQDGHLRWLVGDFTVAGTIDTGLAVLIAVTAFALSMDYEVFLLSRIKEEHDAGRDTTDSVAFGLQRSGRIITAAAMLLAVVFASFVTSGVTSIKQLGLGVAFAIMLDATIVRGLLVPAFMRLAGRWNWWAPRPLAAVHARLGLSEA
jgi:RND superfamily putative drug exporter